MRCGYTPSSSHGIKALDRHSFRRFPGHSFPKERLQGQQSGVLGFLMIRNLGGLIREL